MLARAPASQLKVSTTIDLCFSFPYFCSMCGLEKLGLVDQNWLERKGRFNGAPFSYRNRTPHLYEIFLLRFVIWLLRAYKYRQLRP